MLRYLAWTLCFAASASAPQSRPAFQLAPPTPFATGYVVSAANGDRSARTDEEIFRINQKLARAGNTDAAYQLGLAYMQGIGAQQDFTQAEHWFAIGAVRPDEQQLLASFYVDGHHLPQDPEKAAYWFRRAGRPSDLFELAEMYRRARPSQVASAAEIYRGLLQQTGQPEVRRAQIELGGFVLDGSYSAGDDAHGRSLNLEWARSLAQELLGQSDYNLASDYEFGREGIPVNMQMWARFCARAAAYNIDLAQEFLAEGIRSGTVPDGTPAEAYAWVRLASDKRDADRLKLRSMEQAMTPEQHKQAEAAFEALVQTQAHDGAYYRASDPLREPDAKALSAMPDDDPNVELRRAFALEARHTPENDEEALKLYRKIRDTSWMAEMGVLGRAYMTATDGLPRNPALALRWLERSVEAGYKPAALTLADWYTGQGGGTVDPAQAEAWRWIGGGSEAPIAGPTLTTEQRQRAIGQFKAWIAAHPGWVDRPA